MTRPKLDSATLRRLAVRASCDTRTIEKAYRGEPIRGLAGYRARSVLRKAGLLPAASDPVQGGEE